MKKYDIRKTMKIAAREASHGVKKGHGGPFGAVILKNGKIIAKAHNTVLKTADPTAHAEVNAIRTAAKKLKTFDLSGSALITTCEPCPMCLSAAIWARIDRIYYSATRSDAKKAGFRDDLIYRMFRRKKNKKVAIKKISSRETAAAFEKWQNKADKIIY